MKRHLTTLALILTVLLATTLVRAEAAPTFSVGTAEIPLGGEVTIDITIADMPAAGLNTFGCTVTFEQSKVEVKGVTAGSWYNPEGNMLFLENIDNTNGTVTFGGGMATGGVGSGTLATLTFKGKSITASSAVTLEVFEAKDSTWTDIVSTVSPGSIEVYQQYTLTVSASEGGTTEPTTGTHQYKAGTEVDLTATPNEGYRFYKWTIDGTDVSDAITKVTMDKGKTAQAYFYQPEVTTIEVSGDEGIIIPGLGETAVEKTYTATLKDQHGIEMTGAVTWSVVDDPAGVTIDQSGVLKVTDGAKDVTEVTVKATYGTVTGTLSVSLERATPILTSIAITGDSTVIIPVAGKTTTAEYTATAKDQYGTLIAEQPTFTWSLAAPVTGIEVNTGTGEVTVGDTAVDGSSFTLQATSGEVTGTLSVSLVRATPILTSIAIEGLDSVIIPVDGKTTTAEYTATGKDQYGLEMTGLTFTWSLAEPTTGVSIDETGKVTVDATAVDGSSFTIQATSGEVTGSKNVTLERAASVVTTIEVVGEGTVIIPIPEAADSTEGYTATAKDQYGTVMSDVTFAWSVSGENTTGVTIESGVLTVTDKAVVGTVTVKATYGEGEDAVEGSKEVTLARATSVVTTIDITGPDSVAIPAEEVTTAQYTATAKDQYGEDMTTTFTWSIVGAPVTGVSIDETGKVTVETTAQLGSFTIQATSGTVTNSKTVQVVVATSIPSSIEVSGTEKIVVIDTGATSYQYNAKVFDQYNDEMAEETVTWSVGGTTTGVSIDPDSGQVTITGSEVIEAQTFTVTATSTTEGTVTGQLGVTFKVPADTSTTTVTPDQGLTEVAGPGGSRLVIPAGAVTGETPVNISMTAIPEGERPERPEGYGFIGGDGSLFRFDAEGYEFEQPLTIVLSYANADPQPDPTKLKIVRWSGENMEILGGIVDEDAKTISVTVTGFSDYGIMEDVGVGSVVVSGADSIAIPRSDELDVTSQYEATVKDVNSNTMEGQEVTWSLAAAVEGVSIASDTGLLTITPTATTGNITVVATSVTLPDVTGEIEVEIYNEYILTVAIDGGGTVTPSEGQYRYKDGAKQTLTAEASSGWTFEKWVVTGQEDSFIPTIEVTIDADKTATVYFLRSGTIKIVQDVPVPGGVSEPESGVGVLGGGDPVITLVPGQVDKLGWSKTFHISVADGTIDSISGKLTFDPAKVSIGDVTSEYGPVTWSAESGTMTFSLNASGFTGGELITVRAAALEHTDTEMGGATVTSTLGLTIDNWLASSVSGAEVENYLLGDVDKRYGIKPSDAMETLRFALGLDTFYNVDPVLADVNNDLKVTTADALNILRISVGLAPQ